MGEPMETTPPSFKSTGQEGMIRAGPLGGLRIRTAALSTHCLSLGTVATITPLLSAVAGFKQEGMLPVV